MANKKTNDADGKIVTQNMRRYLGETVIKLGFPNQIFREL